MEPEETYGPGTRSPLLSRRSPALPFLAFIGGDRGSVMGIEKRLCFREPHKSIPKAILNPLQKQEVLLGGSREALPAGMNTILRV
jgi:hypothetical protein